MDKKYTEWFDQLSLADLDQVGGKNSSLGELINHLSRAGIRVPGGFATTADAFRDFVNHGGLKAQIDSILDQLDVDDLNALAATGAKIRGMIMDAPLPERLEAEIREKFAKMEQDAGGALSVAVRSSATAEDLPDASFAGQQETFLNVRGIDAVLHAVREVFASLYNDRAISYRVHKGYAHADVALSAGIQRMARSDIGASGVMFTLDTESGFRDVVMINSSFGLGEMVVQGAVNPDEFFVHKPTLAAGRPAIISRHLGSKAIKMVYAQAGGKAVETVDVDVADRRRFSLTDADVEELARFAMSIEAHYGRPMDIEWAKDGNDGKLYILQARPETVKSNTGVNVLERYALKATGEVLVTGRAIGQKIGAGPVKIITDINQIDQVQPGDVLVTDMTDPNWEPIMKKASAIVTNRGGRTCHAAIIARELGIPAVVGVGNATSVLKAGQEVTVSCAEGEVGNIYKGRLNFERQEISLDTLPEIPVKMYMNIGNPSQALTFAQLPNNGVGLARLEFIINTIGMHPKAALEYPNLPADLKQQVDVKTAGYADPVTFFKTRLIEGIATIAAAFYPRPVIVRMSDFKSNEYANLIGGKRYEPEEENPMLGFRGASRYIAESFRDCFALECEALKYVRDTMGLTNVQIMIPFVRTVGEAVKVHELLGQNGLKRGQNDLKVVMMCELPTNAVLAAQFLEHFDGFSIGSNDMTQLTLGLDRDSGLVAGSFDERDPAVKAMLHMAIAACREAGKYVGICGQGPSDYPDLAEWLVFDEGIESVSLNPDTVIDTWLYLAEAGKKRA